CTDTIIRRNGQQTLVFGTEKTNFVQPTLVAGSRRTSRKTDHRSQLQGPVVRRGSRLANGRLVIYSRSYCSMSSGRLRLNWPLETTRSTPAAFAARKPSTSVWDPNASTGAFEARSGASTSQSTD